MIDSITSIKSKNITPNSSNMYYYLDIISDDNNKLKISTNRNLKISNIFGDISDSELESSLDKIPTIDLNSETTYQNNIQLKMSSGQAISKQYESTDQLDKTISDYINNLTLNPHPNPLCQDITVQYSSVAPMYSVIGNAILTQIDRCCRLIYQENRTSPGNSIIVGSEIFYYIVDIVPKSIKVKYSEQLSNNKIVVLKKDSQVSKGLNLIYDSDQYCLFTTKEWEDCVYWFSVNVPQNLY